MSKKVKLHSAALSEANAAAAWYAENNPDVAMAFLGQLRMGLARVGEFSERWSIQGARTRRYLLRGFPYNIVYVIERDHVVVLAVAHRRRRPGYWESRR